MHNSLNYSEILIKLNSTLSNICQNMADNIMKVESTFPNMGENKQTTKHNPKLSFLHLEGNAEYETAGMMSEKGY